jgi:hypothetical protein
MTCGFPSYPRHGPAGQFFTPRESTDGILGLPKYDEVPVRVEELRELRRGETDETDQQAAIPLGPTPCGSRR